MPTFILRKLSDRMPDFKTVNPGDRIKLSKDVTVEVVSVESSEAMTVKTVDTSVGD
jgi:hypothetical protein